MPQPLASSSARSVAPGAPRGVARAGVLLLLSLALLAAMASGGVALLLGLRDGLRVASLGGLGALDAGPGLLPRPAAFGLCGAGLILIVLPLWAWLGLPPARRRARLGLALITLVLAVVSSPLLLARARGPAPQLAPLGDRPVQAPVSSAF